MSNISGHWNKEHLHVLYKGIDITEEIGLCVCHNCTDHVREKVDALLKNKELAATVPAVAAANNARLEIAEKLLTQWHKYWNHTADLTTAEAVDLQNATYSFIKSSATSTVA